MSFEGSQATVYEVGISDTNLKLGGTVGGVVSEAGVVTVTLGEGADSFPLSSTATT